MEYFGYKSYTFSATSGVPQGSNLGPLLFLIFINDIATNIRNSEYLIYADDFKIYKEIRSVNDSFQLQTNLNTIYDWSIQNNLLF